MRLVVLVEDVDIWMVWMDNDQTLCLFGWQLEEIYVQAPFLGLYCKDAGFGAGRMEMMPGVQGQLAGRRCFFVLVQDDIGREKRC